jgi:hypothetical protein
MKEKEKLRAEDPHLDIPAEANREKHINFMEAEEQGNEESRNRNEEEFMERRQKEWKEGLEEGRKEREENN